MMPSISSYLQSLTKKQADEVREVNDLESAETLTQTADQAALSKRMSLEK